MKLTEAIQLLHPAGLENTAPQQWADFGSGEYLFTRALASLLAPGSRVFAIDRIAMPPEKGVVNIVPVKADFVADELSLVPLDGILMANSLHYVADKYSFLQKAAGHFGKRPLFLVVEYDTDIPVPQWVPYPVSFGELELLAGKLGYTNVKRLGSYDSLYGGTMYAALIRG